MKPVKKVRSVRKVLAAALKATAELSEKMTGKSVNDLPEYFLSVKTAEYLHDELKTFTFSMEDKISNLFREFIDEEEENPDELLRYNGKADLVARSKKTKNMKHVIEFKRSFKKDGLVKDALRLASICRYSPSGHKCETNYLVAVGAGSSKLANTRTSDFEKVIKEKFSKSIKVKFQPVELTGLFSSRGKSKDKQLIGGVWEFKYIES